MRKDGVKVPFSTGAHTLETEKRQYLQSALREDSYLQACVFTFIRTLIGCSCQETSTFNRTHKAETTKGIFN